MTDLDLTPDEEIVDPNISREEESTELEEDPEQEKQDESQKEDETPVNSEDSDELPGIEPECRGGGLGKPQHCVGERANRAGGEC